MNAPLNNDDKFALTAPLEASNVQTFGFDFSDVRVVKVDGVDHFVAKDITDAIDYSTFNTHLLDAVPPEWKGMNPIHTLGGIQMMWTLTEEGVNFFLFRSDKPKAIPMQKWIAGEVLPQIRKTGAYAMPKAVPAGNSSLALARQMLESMEEQARISAQQVAAVNVRVDEVHDRIDVLADLHDTFDVRMAAVMAKAPLAEKPAGQESITRLKEIYSYRHGVPSWIVPHVLTQSEYRILPANIVKNEHEIEDGFARPYAVYQQSLASLAMSRFIKDCVRHPTDARKATHPALPDRAFNLKPEFGKRIAVTVGRAEAAARAADLR